MLLLKRQRKKEQGERIKVGGGSQLNPFETQGSRLKVEGERQGRLGAVLNKYSINNIFQNIYFS